MILGTRALPKRTYTCAGCRGRFLRSGVLPPVGAGRPPGWPWRCRPCHAEHLRLGFLESAASQLRYRRF